MPPLHLSRQRPRSPLRGKFLDGLQRLRHNGSLRYVGEAARFADDDAFKRLLDGLYKTSWVVYAKKAFAGVKHVFSYLGRYTHRVGISNHRIQAFDENGVRFATKDGKTVTVAPLEFIRRFLLHVLPKGFTKIRHYGLFAPGNVHTKLPQAKRLLAAPNTPESEQDEKPIVATPWYELLLRLTGVDPRRCRKCGARLIRQPLPSTRWYEDTS